MAAIKGVVFVLHTGENNFHSVLNTPGSRHPAVTWRTFEACNSESTKSQLVFPRLPVQFS